MTMHPSRNQNIINNNNSIITASKATNRNASMPIDPHRRWAQTQSLLQQQNQLAPAAKSSDDWRHPFIQQLTLRLSEDKLKSAPADAAPDNSQQHQQQHQQLASVTRLSDGWRDQLFQQLIRRLKEGKFTAAPNSDQPLESVAPDVSPVQQRQPQQQQQTNQSNPIRQQKPQRWPNTTGQNEPPPLLSMFEKMLISTQKQLNAAHRQRIREKKLHSTAPASGSDSIPGPLLVPNSGAGPSSVLYSTSAPVSGIVSQQVQQTNAEQQQQISHSSTWSTPPPPPPTPVSTTATGESSTKGAKATSIYTQEEWKIFYD
ncbi:hypothetical protein ACLKA7_000142 [Drosophila subpalustris]